MLEVVPYKPEHYFMIKKDPEHVATLLGTDNVDAIARKFLRGPAFSIFNDDDIVACGGVIKLWPGVGEAWTITSPLVRKFPKFFHRTIKIYLEVIIRIHKLVRVQAMVPEDFLIGRRWVQALGFEYEGKMRQYMGGKTYIRYALIKE